MKNAVKLFEDAGAYVEEVRFGIKRDQKELSDLWCRMIMGASIGTFEAFKKQGLDLLRDYRDDLPEEFIYWLEQAYNMKTIDMFNDQIIRTEIFDSIKKIYSMIMILSSLQH